ncbi:Lipopolysaccharide core biosynthesis protein [Candidatus Ornithobacterium hominis]|uniref:glycosyltransferase family 9 protein n=1 Tax=Candidatus Ornithobacterium hominis TaxID=2497989 RepID=UPI0024BC76ED|nr:glycosyltransferase family 9 protein [Candidatus Ornithobacterium hominis]CAI9430110.1 Lipopolysaccharide core biosynthesis protein [Candidatus Ornithobacterium hominis]
MNPNFHILALRFSSIGDVAMCVPVIDSVLKNNLEVKITFATPKAFHVFFPVHERLNLLDFDKKQEHRGILGLVRFYRQHFNLEFDAVADLHSVLRTQFLRGIFSTLGTPTAYIDKGRAEKKLLTQKDDKELKPLIHTCTRYAQVFEELGCEVPLNFELQNFLGYPNALKDGVGIAPLAKHEEKQFPLEKMKEIVAYLAQKHQVYLLGGKEDEKTLNTLVQPKVENLAGKQSFKEDLELMAGLKFVISMDSANMHLASLVGTRVISVWGATHPYLGFLGYGQSMKDVVQLENLSCRPCSVFGNKTCWRGDLACMNELSFFKTIL